MNNSAARTTCSPCLPFQQYILYAIHTWVIAHLGVGEHVEALKVEHQHVGRGGEEQLFLHVLAART